MSDHLEQELKELIITTLDLEEIGSDDIDAGEPLFGDGLGLDSIDALELGLAISKRYDVKIDADDKTTREHFASVRALADFVRNNRA
ncbi:acyl carrier protein (plasmid) [Alcanivorax sp. N3-2A]|nr:acyl carrier protein [Alcanivorax sp. N3-2A]ASK36784.1 acyl carrier protein [Alcanivorax sp. N3-2A]|tara:strand:- start:35971 stop:36231 length:261 start_codon:yes stop_codon:yes gene_type:complete